MNDDAQSPVLQPRDKSCASDYALDRMRLGELVGTRAGDETLAHLQTCARCRDRMAELAAVRVPPLDFGGLRPRRGGWRLSLIWGIPVCAAAAVVLLLSPWRAATERSKGGGWQLGVVVQHSNGHTERVSPGAVLAPGDHLRFEVAAPHDAFVSVISLDARAAVTAFVPAAGNALPVKVGRRQLLDGAVLLDDSVGPERLLLSACSQAIAVDQVVATAQAELNKANGKIADVGTLPLPCKQTSFWIRKEKRQ
jgi:hypothetical protein